MTSESGNTGPIDVALAETVAALAKVPAEYREALAGPVFKAFMGAQGNAGLPYASVDSGTAPSSAASREGMKRLARAIGVPAESLERAIQIADDGRIKILARIPGETKKEQQVGVALVLLTVRELALGEKAASLDELRELVIDQGCYDPSNFAAYFKRAVAEGILRGGPKGPLLLSGKGLQAGKSLVGAIAAQ